MSVFYKFQPEFKFMLKAEDREIANQMADYELGMSSDLKRCIGEIMARESRMERDNLLRKYMFGKHEKFAPELAEVMETLEVEDGNRILQSLLDKMDKYTETLNSIKEAPTKAEADEIAKKALVY